MKRILDSGALIAWLVQVYLVVDALYGTNKLPARIPIHFGLNGEANGWGSPQMLWMLPVVGTFVGLLTTLIARYPGSFSYPVRVTRENQTRLEGLAQGMIAWLRLEVICLFAWIEWATIESARAQRLALPPASMTLAIAVVFGTIAIYIVRIIRAR